MTIRKKRSGALIIIASIWILLNLAVVVLGCMYISEFGFWSVLLIAGGLSSVGLAVIAVIENKPELLLLDLILPG